MRATAEGTRRYAERHATGAAGGHFRRFDGCSLSSLGLGTYLGDESDAADTRYVESILAALGRGVNVLDTAINYRSQRSERCVGAALAKGTVARDEVIVATKGGFIPADGSGTKDYKKYVDESFIKPGILKREEIVAGCQSIAPRYIADQLERSRKNLGLESIDVYYLHNPEMQLREVTRDEFRQRIRAAFEVLEKAAGEGKIGAYGTATWSGYRVGPGTAGHLSLEEMLEDARAVGGASHHFRVVQLPYNMAMPEAARLGTQQRRGELVPFLEAAAANGIYVMTSASIHQGHLAQGHTPAIRDALPAPSDAARAIQFVRSTAGVGTALVGMGRVAHVEQNAEVVKLPPAPPETVRRLALR